jgi:hypothetical protein
MVIGKIDALLRWPCTRPWCVPVVMAVGFLHCTSVSGQQSSVDASPHLPLDTLIAPSVDAGVKPIDSNSPDLQGPLGRPSTTVQQRIVGARPMVQQDESHRSLWGVTQPAAGEPYTRIDALEVDVLKGQATGPASSMLYFAQMTDVHIVDEESPARVVTLDPVARSAWRTQDSYSLQTLDAMVRKIVRFDNYRAIDFVAFTGDIIDNCQKNELQWFLQVLGGGTVIPNSGDLEDPLSGPNNDPHDPFDALGLGNIPWYSVMGNHDGLIQGNLDLSFGLGYNLVTGDPTRDEVKQASLTRTNDPKCNAIPTVEALEPARCIPTDHKDLNAGLLAADPERVHLQRDQFFQMHLEAGGLPVGHGFGPENVQNKKGDYVADPVDGMPVRIIALDTDADIGAQGAYSNERIDSFLKPALAKAESDGVLVIVISHHPPGSIPLNGGKIREVLNSSPNVALHLVGHGHKNRVEVRSAADPLHGYWEVQTSSLVAWPQQARLIELVDNRDGTAEFWLTMIDYDTEHSELAAASRFMAAYEVHTGEDSGTSHEGDSTDRNVVLPIALPSAVRTRFAQLNGAEIESKQF